jgi:dual specificity phosphatase 12
MHQMKWMESQLEGGQLAGKIMCPNKRCSAKLGNFDWAGVQCACKEWVVPVRANITSLEV